jgi:hypothetical protein
MSKTARVLVVCGNEVVFPEPGYRIQGRYFYLSEKDLHGRIDAILHFSSLCEVINASVRSRSKIFQRPYVNGDYPFERSCLSVKFS